MKLFDRLNTSPTADLIKRVNKIEQRLLSADQRHAKQVEGISFELKRLAARIEKLEQGT